MDRTINPETYMRSYSEAVVHGRFCGNLALLQYEDSRYFITEHPELDLLFDEEIWQVVVRDELNEPRCTQGKKTGSAPPANPFCNLQSSGDHKVIDGVVLLKKKL